jgi:drug/metabolite transporter (DMT)-like permease
VTPAQFAKLVLLAAIWGASFLFMRVAVPQLGPVWLLEIRLISAALFLLLVAQWMREPLRARRYWRHYLFLGTFNTAIPFATMAWAATTLPAGVLSVINATAPLCGLVVGFVWRRKPVTLRALLGLCCGMAGVATIAGLGRGEIGPEAITAVAVCMLAPVCYGIASSYAEFAERVPAFANAHGSVWASVVLIVPLMGTAPVPATWPVSAVAAGVVLGVVCSGVAYLLYFHLVSTVGAASALTVGYLIPLFGVTWGWLFLGEPIGWHTIGGAALVLTGTALVTGLDPRSLLRRRPPAAESASGQA